MKNRVINYFRSQGKLIGQFIGWAVFLFLIFLFIQKLPQIIEVLSQIRWPFLIPAIIWQLIKHSSVGLAFRSYLRQPNFRLSLFRATKLAFATAYINRVIPSWGIAGIFFLTRSLRKDQVKPEKTITLGSLITALNLTMVFLLMIVSIGYLIFKQELTKIQALAAFFSVLIILTVLMVIIYFTQNKVRFRKFLNFFLKPIDKVASFFSKQNNKNHQKKPNNLQTILNVDYLVHQLPAEFRKLWVGKKILFKLFLAVFFFYFSDLMTVYFVFLGFNFNIHPAVLLSGFVFTLIFAFISLVPSDVGIFETSMTLIYSGLGVPLSVALVGALAFRVLSYWLFIPFGYFILREIK